MPGQEGIPSVFSPMTRTLEDLNYFTKSMIGMQPWKYDHSVHPIPWRQEAATAAAEQKNFKVGVLRTDGVVDPSPACARAVDEVVAALLKEGHEVVDVEPPSPYEALYIGSQLLNADGCKTFKSFFRTGEWEDPGARQMSFLMNLPSPFRWAYYLWVKYVRRDDIWAGLIKDWREKSSYEQWKFVAKREAYKAKFHDWWESEAKIDFMITPPNATPAVPHDGMKDAGQQANEIKLDYTCGIMPITHVDKALDQLSSDFSIKRLNGVAQGAYKHYDATAMHGLPVAIQVVGQRLEEEKVLAVMKRIEDALGDDKYQLLDID
ncbi:putative Acetamidase [Glarea lozoyensis 74030]|uniref:Putative Acetamidase n=1 Tax=Glarea lozoyensis (strain ATCC 74030 / MF5533) TaxID=1104152 RepID=H0ETV0_GLAL7|nr:putative Acetamidase [Glarea lozoyensis 74030]